MAGKGGKGFVLLFEIWFSLDFNFFNIESSDMNSMAKCWEKNPGI